MLSFTKSRYAGKNLFYRKICLIIIFLSLFSIPIQSQNGWTNITTIPTGRGASFASVIGEKIYVIGGASEFTFTDMNNNEVYNTLTNTWDTLAPMPTPRGYLMGAVVNDTIYAVGGGYPTHSNKVEAYDPLTDTWTTKSSMPVGIRSTQAGVVDGIIYIIGGNSSTRNCYAYNPATNVWTEKTPVPVGGGGDLAVAVYNGLIYTFGGGYYDTGGPKSNVYAYNPQTDQWTQKTNMPTARFVLQAYVVGNKIYAIGGSQAHGTSVAKVEVYYPDIDTWVSRADMPFNLAWFASAVVNNKIYVISGSADWLTGDGSVWEYDPSQDPTETPVELTSFTASSNGKNVTLNWSTASEINNYGFEVQRCKNENKFFTIGFVNGKGTTTQNQNYTFIDNSLNSGKYCYRLKQIDYDGSYEYSDVVEVEWRRFNSYLLEQNYPNPFNPTTKIGFGIRENSRVRLSLFNSIGEEVAILVDGEIEQGFHQVEFNAGNLPSGIYYYQLKTGSYTATKKLLLLK
jgi:N-acetylneuraminic acid mutarotase